MADIITLGEFLVDMFPLGEGTSLNNISGFMPVPGGAPANVAVGVARLGGSSAFIGRVGDDVFGHWLQETLFQNRVDTTQLQFDERIKTTLAFIIPTKKREVDFLFYRNPGADIMLEPEKIDPNFIGKGKIFHCGSISMISEPSRSATQRALDCAEKAGLLTSFDPNLRLPLWESEDKARATIIESLRRADIIKLNDTELEFITGIKSDKKATEKILGFGPRMVIVTRGQRPTFFNNGRFHGEVETFRVKVVDSVGCGDAFVAGILVNLLSRVKSKTEIFSLELCEMIKIIKFANAAAALTATRKGVITALPFKKEVEDLLKLSNN